MTHPVLARVTARIAERSAAPRAAYLRMLQAQRRPGRFREGLGCANVAHAFAAMPAADKLALREARTPNLGLVTAYNDMLSAHQPYERYPAIVREAARALGATAQVAGGVPAMCDGVTQGTEGMELSLFSREVIAMATAVSLTHNVFDAALMLGVCDKIVPGLLMGALQFGHLPVVFVPAGPMASGLANEAKAKVRQQYAQGLVDRAALLAAEEAAYHGPGTCTFYGTANSNQMLLEVMGLQLPGASFVHPDSTLREPLTREAVRVALDPATPALGTVLDERAIANGIVGLLATGGSTNHTLHLVAVARAAGLVVDWDDFAELSAVVPLLARVYPNGQADVNHFHAAGGMGFVIGQLLAGGLLHEDVQTVLGPGLSRFAAEPWLDAGRLAWRDAPRESAERSVLRTLDDPFSTDGGLKCLQGRLGRAVIKTSAVAPAHRRVLAPAVVVESQQQLAALFHAGALQRDFIAVVRHQGPQANGMPELHKLTPLLGSLQDAGFRVALVTDGRMSGASGKVPAAIHVTPEAAAGGPLGRVRDGDMLLLDAEAGVLDLHGEVAGFESRAPAALAAEAEPGTAGRGLFQLFRAHAAAAEAGASPLFSAWENR
ncbi:MULTISPECIES: phosphogluconate dehydratase [Ramlibacter]|uniref:Phosphogluconate dehydratase n=1 Tax=Ramlibacter aquaticus TaxID=2780094 RepID=A0ABR9SGF0_9BURK|nr:MULTISPECIES: phosphogluconate dehydratase [Ramlibacter]MBE7941423.1 phosphogluconate dehydratase [Ramlibacter aquaticus]